MKRNDRREFLKRSAALLTGAAVTPYFLSSTQPLRAQAPSDRLRTAVVGYGDRARGIAYWFNRLTDVVAVADVDSNRLDFAGENGLGKKNATGDVSLDVYKDYRKIIERKDIDIVHVSTPDHWHTKIAVEAMQAGKHVFCEKPLTLTIAENKLIRDACKKYGKVLQVGSQRRCQRDVFMVAILMAKKGMLGDLKRIVCDIRPCPTSDAIPKQPVPETLDFDMWLGQAPEAGYLASNEMHGSEKGAWPEFGRTHYNFRWFYEYGGGKFTDWGAHFIDSAMLALDRTGPGQGPTLVKPIEVEHPVPFKDGYPTVSDRYNTSHKFRIDCVFPGDVVMEVCSESPDGTGILFEGTKGRIHANLERIKGKPYEMIGGKAGENGHAVPYPENAELQKHLTPEDFATFYKGKPVEGHLDNFLTCVREGGEPVSDVFSTAQVMNVCHLCTIAARLNREVAWDPEAETTLDEQSRSFLAREQRKGYELPDVS